MMKIILGLISAVLLIVTSTAHATLVLVGTTTNPTGINGIVVDGVTYNTTFLTADVASPLFSAGTQASTDARNALVTALNSLGVTRLLGVGANNTLGVDGVRFGDLATNLLAGPWTVGTGNLTNIPYGCSGSLPSCMESVSWTLVSSAVPEPATLALLGLGLFGVAVARRRSR